MTQSMHQFGKTALLGAAIAISTVACSSNPKNATPEPIAQSVVKPTPFELTTSRRGPVLTLEDVQFDFEKAGLRAESESLIRQAADYLRKNPDRIALVEGHTDHTGDRSYNIMLSKARSQSVQEALIRQGVSPSRIQTHGLGEAQPVASNLTPDGRQANRRVEIIFKRRGETLSSL